MAMLPNKTDVLIIGAGPTGLALAAELRRQGVAALILDRQAEAANTSRAAVVHARTLEVLEPLGATRDLLREGLKIVTFRMRDRDATLATIDFSHIPSPYLYTLMCPQNRTEAVLLARLRALGGDVVRPVELREVRATETGVTVHVETAGGGQEKGGQEKSGYDIEAGWLVGCDGMHSRVRDAAGIGFAGAAYEQGFVLADVRMDWPLGRDEVDLFISPGGLVVVAPLPGDHFRVVATQDDAPEHPTIADVQAILDWRGPQTPRARVTDCVWTSRFHVHHRIAEWPRRGRVLLCGDAAHVHSPAGGQGMNTGIQDAIALAGVLPAVLAGGSETALDAWAKDRHEVATDVVSFTDRMTRMGTVRSPMGRTLRNNALRVAGRIPAVRRALARRLSEIR